MAKPESPDHRARYAIAVICLVAIVVHGSLLTAPSLIWDDHVNIFENPNYVQGTWRALWAHPYFGLYIPVMSSIWAALYHAFEGAVWPFRVLNVLLHVANILLFRQLLAALLRRFDIRSNSALVLAVAIFALHPEQTAVVSWLSGARDLAATMFAFAAVAVLFTAWRQRALLSTALFASGMLCKPHVAAVPIAVLLYVWCFERSRLREMLFTMSAWALIVVASAYVTSRAQSGFVALPVPLWQRPIVALDALGFYLIKSVWPFPLAADYGRTPVALFHNPSQMVPTLAVFTLAAAMLWWVSRRNRQYAFSVIWVVMLTPVLGLLTFAYQSISTVADHYNYIPLAVFATLVAIAVGRSKWRDARILWITAALVVVAGASTSYVRAQDWSSNERFFADMLAKNPASFSARINLAQTLCERGDWREGLPLIQAASSEQPAAAPYLANLSFCLFRAERYDEVLALQQRLADPIVRANLDGNQDAATTLVNAFSGAFVMTDRPLQAFAYLCQGLAIDPLNAEIAVNMKSVQQSIRERGAEVRCPGRLAWEELRSAVAQMP